MIYGAPVIGVAGTDGAVGKSTTSGQIAISAAAQGYNVLIVDGDSSSDIIALFSGALNSEDDSMETIVTNDPENNSLQRIFTRPELGLNDIAWEYSFHDIFKELEAINRPSSLGVVTAGLKDSVRHTYGIKDSTKGSITIVPNGAGLNELVSELYLKTGDPSIFKRALQQAIQYHVEAGNHGFDLIIIDFPGDSGHFVSTACLACDYILPMFAMNRNTSWSSMVTLISDAVVPLYSSAYSHQVAQVLPALPNFWDTSDEVSEQAIIAKIKRYISVRKKKLGPVDLTISDRHIPLSYSLWLKMSKVSMLPFSVNPLDDALVAMQLLWEYLKTNMKGRD
jgi:cellulose biosynthesis protein BcsQ